MFEDASDVENMAAADLDTGALVVTLGVANGAVVITILTHGKFFIFLDTVRVKTR
jgi:hypothetical protein